MILSLRQFKPSPHMVWRVPLGLAVAPFAGIAVLAAHVSFAFGLGSPDDPLGYAVIATK
ncbi:MAG: hypothetical protein JSR96_14875 [Proteobacteria bacterium]|nr:hypothetical protein [Pseudomonadota bacterium]